MQMQLDCISSILKIKIIILVGFEQILSLPSNQSPRAKACRLKLDGTSIRLTGLNVAAFECLHTLFMLLFYSHIPHSNDGYHIQMIGACTSFMRSKDANIHAS